MTEFRDFTEKTLSRQDYYSGKILSVHVDKVLLPNGHTSTREVVDHMDGVGILALDDQNRVLLVTQYRYVFGRTLLELPAGKLDRPGEDPRAGALRELQEETGAIPGRFESLGKIIPAPGCYQETLHLFLARDLTFTEQNLDPDEFLNVSRVPFNELLQKCLSGEVEDAKTVTAVLKAKLLLNL